jgi:hypothetical protein
MMSLNKKNLAKFEIIFHITNTIVCLLLMFLLEGNQKALSNFARYPTTDIIFKWWISVLAIGGFRNGKMKYAATFLLGVVIWDNIPLGSLQMWLHNISAIGFFLSITIVFFQSKHYQILGVLMILGSSICGYSLMIAELAAVVLIIYYSIDIYFRIK